MIGGVNGGGGHRTQLNNWCAFGVPPAPVYKEGEEEAGRGCAPWGESYHRREKEGEGEGKGKGVAPPPP